MFFEGHGIREQAETTRRKSFYNIPKEGNYNCYTTSSVLSWLMWKVFILFGCYLLSCKHVTTISVLNDKAPVTAILLLNANAPVTSIIIIVQVIDLENKLRDQMQQSESSSLTLQQKVRALVVIANVKAQITLT